ncbi:MAG: hypothetical protein JXB88_13685 [Spirochaetales bacterium]|nr:hypothetical protein [Spirochaetales bacterium]
MKENRVLFIVLLVFVLSLIGCETTSENIISSADKTYSKMIHKVFVIITELHKDEFLLPGEIIKSYNDFKRRMKILNTFKSQIETEFKNIGIESECYIFTGLELDDSELNNRISSFFPDAILYINGTAVKVNEISMSSRYEVSFVDIPTEKKFWKADFTLNSIPSLRADYFASALFKTIYEQLKKDEMYILGTIEPL